MIGLLCPESGAPLKADTPHSVVGPDGTRWPVVEGIAFLRRNREALRDATLAALDADDAEMALALLLTDQDDFAPLPPPQISTLRALIHDHDVTFRQAMAALNFGPVASYFAHRWSAPTFLSGLSLIALFAPPRVPLLEVCCGTGQLLREVEARGGSAVGVDQVFAKLWLGRRFLGVQHLVCADAETLPVALTEGATVLIHDALYFIKDEDKPLVLAAMARAAAGQPLLAGHLHLADHPHGGGRAHPLPLAEWQALLPGAAVFDDAALTEWFVSQGRRAPGPPSDAGATAAVCLALGERLAEPWPVWEPTPQPLTANPLLVNEPDGAIGPRWPSPAFAEEYAEASYLTLPSAAALAQMSPVEQHARRAVLPLPPRW